MNQTSATATLAVQIAAGNTVTAGESAPIIGIRPGGISCPPGAETCVVVGYGQDASNSEVGFFATVTPGQVATASTINGVEYLVGVSCPTAGSCEAVGQDQTYHGLILPITTTAGSPTVLYNVQTLNAISCVGEDCETVGSTGSYLAVAALTGGTVTAVRGLPETGQLEGVACLGPTQCLAAGRAISDGNTKGYLLGVGPVGPASPVPPPPFCDGLLHASAVGVASTPDGGGYWMTDSVGDVVACGDAQVEDPPAPTHLAAPVVGIASGPDDHSFYLVAADGGVFNAGNAAFHGSAGNLTLTKPVVGMATDPKTGGYWLVAADGGVFNYDAPFEVSAGNLTLNKPVVGMASTADDNGYRLVAADGGVFAYNAAFHGSAFNLNLTQPIVSIADDATGDGYWLAAGDGGIFSYDAPFHGSAGNLTLTEPVVGMSADPTSGGYRLVAGDGGIFCYGGAAFDGAAT